MMAPRTTFPTEAEVQQLQQAGFSHDQVSDLLTLRSLYIQGAYYENDPPAAPRIHVDAAARRCAFSHVVVGPDGWRVRDGEVAACNEGP